MADVTHLKRDTERDGEAGEGSIAFTLTKPVDPSSLDRELSTAMNWRKDAGLTMEGNAAEASTENPLTIWAHRDDVDEAVLKKAVTAHQVPEPQADPLTDLVARARAGDDFTPEEVQTLLRVLVLFIAGSGAGPV